MEHLKLNNISFTENGKRINYNYSASASSILNLLNIEKPLYSKYQIDVSDVPLSIAVIPFLCNLLPIAWYAGFIIEVDEVDDAFYIAQEKLKAEFAKRKDAGNFKGDLIAKKKIKNTINGNNTSMLFSGGVDAYATYIRIFDQNPDLITIHGADIEIEDHEQWTDFTDFLEAEKLLKNKKYYIETNLRDFYTYQVELLLEDIGWWGKVQHGLALNGAVAPLSYINGYKSIYIASSYTDSIDIDWGSTPEIDSKITWANDFKVYHDGYDLKRQDKVDLIANFSTDSKFKLRVCYSELRTKTEFNCSNCEKCFRTILGLILNDKNPNDYGFIVNNEVYSKFYKILEAGAASKGVKYFWWELMQKAQNNEKFFVFDNLELETIEIDKIKEGAIDNLLEKKLNNPNLKKQRIRFIIRNKFPWVPKLYRELKKLTTVNKS